MKPKRPRPPLGPDSLRELALGYVGRFATSRAKLVAYLERKLRERGWDADSAADPGALADRFVALGYIDDASFAAAKGAALARRGYGARRVDAALRGAGIGETDRSDARDQAHAERWSAAERFARRKRIGPFANEACPPDRRERMIAAFLRAGHDMATARQWIDALPGEPPEQSED
ncbi:MAG: RecX family transcriptional regulator [Sphingobium sp.]